MTWPDGSVFTGTFQDGKRHGSGSMKWADGRFYEGEWAFDMMCGQRVQKPPLKIGMMKTIGIN